MKPSPSDSPKRTDRLSIVHAAYLLGADTPGKVEKATGVQYDSANQCLVWIRKADGDLELARKLRSQNCLASQTRRIVKLATEIATGQPTEDQPSSGNFAKELLRDSKTNEEVLTAVLDRFPDAQTSLGTVRWYRNRMIAAGENVPTSVEARCLARLRQEAVK